MFKKTLLLIFFNLLFISISHAKVNYIPSQLAQFLQTHICNNCDLSGVILTDYNTTSDLSHAQLQSAILDYAKSSSNSGMAVDMNNSDFTGARLVKGDFNNLMAGASLFDRADLQEASFRFANLSGSSFKNANLKNADFEGASLTSCDFTGVDFSGANLAGADFMRSIVSKQQLAKAASLSGTILPDGTVCGIKKN